MKNIESQNKVRWTDKYNDYLPDRKIKSEKLSKKYKVEMNYLLGLGLKESERGECVICGDFTHYKDIKTNKHVCCNACKYQQEKLKREEIFDVQD